MNRTYATVFGALFIVAGLAVPVKWIVTGHTASPSRFVDVAFMLFFFVRGAMYLRTGRRTPRPPLS